MFKVYVYNDYEYANGKLLGKWINLPAIDSEIKKELEEIEVGPEDEYIVAGCENDYKYNVDETCGLNELNKIAKELESMDDSEREVYIAFMDAGYTHDVAMKHIKDEDYNIAPGADIYEAAGWVASEAGYFDKAGDLGDYVDWVGYFDWYCFKPLPCEGGYIYMNALPKL